MTKVKALLASSAAVEQEAQPHEPLHLVLQTVRNMAQGAAGMSLVPMAALYTSNNIVVPDWDGPQRCVGTADMTVVFRAQSQADLISQLMDRMAAQEQRHAAQEQRHEEFKAAQEELNAFMCALRISNAAAQVLKHAAGDEFYVSPDSCRFSNLGAAHTSIRQLSTLTGTAVETIITRADQIITQRNNKHAHFPTADALQAEVEACKRALTLCPTLRKLRSECWVLDNFAHFKAAFHPNLG